MGKTNKMMDEHKNTDETIIKILDDYFELHKMFNALVDLIQTADDEQLQILKNGVIKLENPYA